MRAHFGTIVAVVGCSVLSWLAIVPAGAGDTVASCSVEQVTPSSAAGPVSLGPHSISGDGKVVAFTAWDDLAGENPGTDQQVFVYGTDNGAFEQAPGAGTVLSDPKVSADGSIVAYDRWDGDSSEVYVYDLTVGSVDQLTDEGGTNVPVGVSSDGSRVLYLSLLNPLPGAFGPWSMSTVDVASGDRQLLIADAGSLQPGRIDGVDLAADGTMVAFVSEGSVGNDPGDEALQLFLYDIAAGELRQVTGLQGWDFAGQSERIQFTDDDQTVTFNANGWVIDENRTGLGDNYRLDVASGVVTRETGVPSTVAFEPSADGQRYVFTSREDLTGDNPDRTQEMFSYERATGLTTQLTSAEEATSNLVGGGVASSGDGTTVAFVANEDNTGENPDGDNQLFIAHTCDPSPRPDLRVASTVSGPYTGRDVYSAAPNGAQRRTATVARGGSRSFFVRVQNDRLAADSFTLSGVDAGASGYDVTYRRAGVDITGAVEAGTYVTGSIEPGAYVTIKVAVHAGPTAGRGHRVDVLARSDTNPVARDTVRAKVTRT